MIFMMLGMLIFFNVAIYTDQGPETSARTKLVQEIDHCFSQKATLTCLNSKWHQSSISDKITIMGLLADKENQEVDLFFKTQFKKTKDIGIRGLLFFRIAERKKATNIQFFIDRLKDNRKMGHENQPVYDFACSYLRSKILLEFPFDGESFRTSADYRRMIKILYKDWLKNNLKQGTIIYSEKYDMFILKSTTEDQIDRHFQWKWDSKH